MSLNQVPINSDFGSVIIAVCLTWKHFYCACSYIFHEFRLIPSSPWVPLPWDSGGSSGVFLQPWKWVTAVGDIPHCDLISADGSHWLALLCHLFIAHALPGGIQRCLTY